MTTDEWAADALFDDPLPAGFSRQVLCVDTGLELGLGPERWPDIVVVERGVVELECRGGTSRRFGRGAMIPLARLPLAHLRSVGPTPLVLVAITRDARTDTDEFFGLAGSYGDD